MERSRLAIIIPALNEANTIESVLASVLKYGIPIVVDDGSSDATSAIARIAGAQVVQHAHNQGYDSALSSGFAAAEKLGCEYIITMDADGQHDPEQLNKYIFQLEAGYEVVLGVRDRLQRIAETVFARVGKFLWGISDPLCGMKGYSIGAYKRMGSFGTFKSIGTELAVRTILSGAKYSEVSVRTHARADAPRFGGSMNANLKILNALLVLLYRNFTNQLKK